jgi:hypothetical protein
MALAAGKASPIFLTPDIASSRNTVPFRRRSAGRSGVIGRPPTLASPSIASLLALETVVLNSFVILQSAIPSIVALIEPHVG